MDDAEKGNNGEREGLLVIPRTGWNSALGMTTKFYGEERPDLRHQGKFRRAPIKTIGVNSRRNGWKRPGSACRVQLLVLERGCCSRVGKIDDDIFG